MQAFFSFIDPFLKLLFFFKITFFLIFYTCYIGIG